MVERLNTEEMLNLCKGAQHKRDVAGWKWLHQYERADGTKVEGYYRRK